MMDLGDVYNILQRFVILQFANYIFRTYPTAL
jgi:hypothetical protein